MSKPNAIRAPGGTLVLCDAGGCGDDLERRGRDQASRAPRARGNQLRASKPEHVVPLEVIATAWRRHADLRGCRRSWGEPDYGNILPLFLGQPAGGQFVELLQRPAIRRGGDLQRAGRRAGFERVLSERELIWVIPDSLILTAPPAPGEDVTQSAPGRGQLISFRIGRPIPSGPLAAFAPRRPLLVCGPGSPVGTAGDAAAGGRSSLRVGATRVRRGPQGSALLWREGTARAGPPASWPAFPRFAAVRLPRRSALCVERSRGTDPPKAALADEATREIDGIGAPTSRVTSSPPYDAGSLAQALAHVPERPRRARPWSGGTRGLNSFSWIERPRSARPPRPRRFSTRVAGERR